MLLNHNSYLFSLILFFKIYLMLRYNIFANWAEQVINLKFIRFGVIHSQNEYDYAERIIFKNGGPQKCR